MDREKRAEQQAVRDALARGLYNSERHRHRASAEYLQKMAEAKKAMEEHDRRARERSEKLMVHRAEHKKKRPRPPSE